MAAVIHQQDDEYPALMQCLPKLIMQLAQD
jgi:hypothetical protein